MRKETMKIAKAFKQGEKAAAARTSTDGQTVWLHGHRIAYRDENNNLCITLAGWPTVTTRDRINGILDVFGLTRWGVAQRNHKQYLVKDGKPFMEISKDSITCMSDVT